MISDLVSWISISEGLRILNKSGHYQTKSVIKVRNLNVISEVWVTQVFHNSVKEIRVIRYKYSTDPTFTITETNLYVPIVTLSIQDNAKLLPQLKSGFKRTISWNKYFAKPELLAQNSNLNHLIEPSFQGVNRPFVLAFEDDAQRISNKRYYISNVEIKDYNVMID